MPNYSLRKRHVCPKCGASLRVVKEPKGSRPSSSYKCSKCDWNGWASQAHINYYRKK